MCNALEISRSGYYNWSKRGLSNRARENHLLQQKVLSVFNSNRKVYGFRRIKKELERQGVNYSHKRIRKIMNQLGISAKPRKKRKIITTDSKGNNLIYPNLLKDKVAERPSEIIASDITYIRTTEGWLFLAVVIDLFTREVLGYATDRKMPSELIKRALINAFANSDTQKIKIFHSDRGKQFSSLEIKNLLRFRNITQSMSRKGNCYDNARVESFFHTLKTEWLYRDKVSDYRTTVLKIFKYIEGFYNTRRLHSAIGYLTPKEMKSKFEFENTY